MQQEIRLKLINRLRDGHNIHMDESKFTSGARLEYDIGLDMFGRASFVNWVEREFNILVSKTAFVKIKTFGEIIQYVEHKRKQKYGR